MGLLIEGAPARGAMRLALGRPAPLVGLAIAIAVAVGTLLAAAPLPVFGAVVGAVVIVLMAALGRDSAKVFVISLGVLLVAYAFFGRGVAYVGTGSFYVGEAVLLLGVLAFLLNLGQARFGPLHWLIVVFIALGVVQTLPYLGPFGLLALRDGVVWGYAVFALAVATTFDQRWSEPLVRAYGRLVPAFLLWVPVSTWLDLSLRESLPGWPGAPVPFIVVKQGDFAVLLAGIAAFVLVGLYDRGRGRIPSGLIWALVFVDLALVAAVSRGGLLAAAVGTASVLLFARSLQRILTAGGIALAGFILLFALNPSIDVGSNQGRTLSFNQLVENVGSVVFETDRGNLQGTKEWRLAWWDKIVGYTVDGPYFWTGKGFGVNLADDDGFQVLADRSLRAPHNGHIALLARGGVPLLAVWIILQAAFGIGLLSAARRARAAGRPLLVQLAAWTFAIWAAALVNMTFDVYLEGPQGGIWFWSVVGFGLVVMDAARRAGLERGTRPRAAVPGSEPPAVVAEPGAPVVSPPAWLAHAPRPAPSEAKPVRESASEHRPRPGDTAPAHLLRAPGSGTASTDSFIDALVRRVEGDR